jgi:hypothetical protein
MIREFVLGLVASTCIVSPAFAWWDEGHMQIAAVAYSQLTLPARTQVDALIRLNPEYSKWVVAYPAARAAQYAFVRSATWADDIKKPEAGYDSDKADAPEASRNIGYYDDLMHKYWHFKDIGFSTDGTPLQDGDAVNALTEIKILSAGLKPSSGLPDDVRSYDLVWLIHLVGDAHQPLHATARFSQAHPKGDQGGNLDDVIPATGEMIKLHAYWDRLLGSYSTPDGAIYDAFQDKTTKLPAADPALASDLNPDDWFQQGEKLAEQYVYAEPVKSGTAHARP